ncbi:MAG: ribosomal protein S6--L-glutamate ligase [Candidatus Omnitrophota bacterium]|jgi:ribosomal protein S6--L-glutamate ligase
MKIGILSRESKNYSTRKLKEACVRRGHKVKVFDTLRFTIHVEKNQPSLHYENKPFAPLDAVIPRIGASITFYGMAVVRQFEQMGVFALSSSKAIGASRDKLHALQVLSKHNIGIPVTEFVKMKGAVIPSIEGMGGAPVVVKLLEGTQGTGVILADSINTAEAIVETLQGAKQNVLIQSLVKESKGRDIRAFVVGGKVVACMRRVAKKGEFRSNLHRGGHVEAITQLDPVYERTAIRAAQVLGLDVAGVDMLEGKDGPMLMEVNSSPGLEGIERASKIDVADAIVDYLEKRVSFPEIDIRQRLTLSSGYGVADVRICSTSSIIGKSIRESGLREKDINIISLTRDGQTIPNPKVDRIIQDGDVLLCFGKLEEVKSIMPQPKVRKRKQVGSSGQKKD